MSHLAEYLNSHGIKQRAFAEKIGVDPSIVSRLVRGEMKPSLDLAFSIEAVTAGRVAARTWAASQIQHQISLHSPKPGRAARPARPVHS